VSPRRGRPRRDQALAILIVPVVVLTAIFTAVIALERAAPRAEPGPDLRIANLDLPVLGGEPTRCIRGTAEDRVAEVRAQITPGSRITSELVNACPAAFEGLGLTYVGEVIGHYLDREDGGWVQVNDDDYALRTGPLPAQNGFRGLNSSLAVWLPHDLAERLTGFGGPGRRGDVVELSGAVVRTDPADGGGLTFRASDLRVLAPSVAIEQPFHLLQAVAAGGLSVVALGVAIGLHRSRRDSR
jgi:hypothetical protein